MGGVPDVAVGVFIFSLVLCRSRQGEGFFWVFLAHNYTLVDILLI